jgi:hypothetical protein
MRENGKRARRVALVAGTALALASVACATPAPTGGPVSQATIDPQYLTSAPSVAHQDGYALNTYPLCSSFPDYGNAPCVVATLNDGIEGYTWVAVSTAGDLVEVQFRACVTEDDPGPCVWDSVNRGNGIAGPGVAQFLINREG